MRKNQYFYGDWTKIREIIGKAFIEETGVTGLIKDSDLAPDGDKRIYKIKKIDDNHAFINALEALINVEAENK